MGNRLENRKALITGGSRGIGRAIALAFAAEGCDLFFCHWKDPENATVTQSKIEQMGRQVGAIEANVADEASVTNLVTEATRFLGQIDILVNCAGIGGDVSFEAITPTAWDEMINVHLRGTFLVTHACYTGMAAQGGGRIINIASQLAYKGAPQLSHYCAAKAGIIGFTRALSYEAVSKGILVNAIAPGPTETDMLAGLTDEWRAMKLAQLPIGRFGQPEEIAPTAVMLASSDGNFYVGQTLSPNGGDVML
ncbi:MAG: 3-oxoacyl-ACP reductase FabG [Oculatellaceae cyanobacterium Prado106]|jgi:3-oxoacyl-[acyl-carrier protein] reductase|nr:3-oxoacyl-ACP reductase FabG [Oculatellaceae cyanobacterium Prado106]